MQEMSMPGQQPEDHKKRTLDLGGLFGGGKKKEPQGPGVQDLLVQLSEVSRRLRIIESRYSDLNRRAQLDEKNLLSQRKRHTTTIKTMDSDILDVKKEIGDMGVKLDMIIGQVKELAPKTDVEVIRKYVDLWEPVNFVTREEVETIVKDMLDE